MNLYEQIICNILSREPAQIYFPQLRLDFTKLVQNSCCLAVMHIKEIIDDPTLDDPQCYRKIEEIIRVYEQLGSDGGFRHDKGYRTINLNKRDVR